MARGDFLCPLCGQILGLLAPSVKSATDVVRDSAIGGHLHIEVAGTLTCPNAHKWEASGSFLLTRIS